MTTATCLSNDVISIILSDESISIKDIVSFTSTCKRFYSVTDNNNVLWKKKLYQRWPWLKTIYDKQICKEHFNFEEQVKASTKCRKELRYYLSQMSQKHYYKDDLSDNDMKDFNSMFCPEESAHPMNYYFLIDELINLLTSPKQSDYDLTQKYYARKLLPYLQQHRMRNVWQKFINYSEKQQLLEQAATIVAQWFQPQKYISYSQVKASLSNIAQQVLECLKEKHPMHPIFSISTKQFSLWEDSNIDDNQWNNTEGLQIIDHIKNILFDKLGFCGSFTNNVDNDVDNEINNKNKAEHSLIDCVLENRIGNAVSLAIIFQSVARRLGIRCDIVYYPVHFFLTWKAKYNMAKSEDEECFYIDILHKGSFRSRNDCPKIRGTRRCPIENFNVYTKPNPAEVMSYLIKHLQMVNYGYQTRFTQCRLLLELQHLIDPDNLDTIQQLNYYYTQHRMMLANFVTEVKRIQEACKNNKVVNRRAEVILHNISQYQCVLNMSYFHTKEAKQKTKEIKFPVGSVVTFHERLGTYDFRITGVIIGWDTNFNQFVEFDSKISCKKDTTLTQPFYKILCEDGRMYYIGQEILIEEVPRWINHKEIGRYFCKFEETHYVPNQMLANHYPSDFENFSENT